MTLPSSGDLSDEVIDAYDKAICEVAVGEFELDCYPNQIEIITSAQMLDAYAATGLPIHYPHWSFGKEFMRNADAYQKGQRGLAYEIVINTNPCIAYLMEDNSIPIQGLVIAHASYGHNSFFKGNYLFREKQGVPADAIIDFLVFARDFVKKQEERHGIAAVERILDSAHALQSYGIDRTVRPKERSATEEEKRTRTREENAWQRYDDVLAHTTKTPEKVKTEGDENVLNDDNLLYFIEKHSPKLKDWERELVRIVRKIGQYFYPQGLTKVMNEGWATFWHYEVIQRLHQKGLVDDSFMIEFLVSHTNVTTQQGFNRRGYSGFNPYTLGLDIFRDIRRVCEGKDPVTGETCSRDVRTEDERWFPHLIGTDWKKALNEAMRNFKDETFVQQFLSPTLMRRYRMFAVSKDDDRAYNVDAIHNDEGYRSVRRTLAGQYAYAFYHPEIIISGYNRHSDRSLELLYRSPSGRDLDTASAKKVLAHTARLHGFPVVMHCEVAGLAKYKLEGYPHQ